MRWSRLGDRGLRRLSIVERKPSVSWPPAVCEVGLAVLVGGAPAVGEASSRLAHAGGAQTVLDPGFGHRQSVRLGSAPAIARQPAREGGAAAGARSAATGGRRRRRRPAPRLSPAGAQGKIVPYGNRI